MTAGHEGLGARLRGERERRGWTRAQMARRVRAQLSGTQVPDVDSIVSYLKRHEAGKTGISGRYRDAYAAALDLDPADLFAERHDQEHGGIFTLDDQERLILAARNPVRLDDAVIGGLAATLASQRRIEDLIGSQAVVEPALANLRLMLRLLREARGDAADRLAAVASEGSQFAGWLHTATGAHDAAGGLYDQALRLGLQARADDLVATALSMRGHLAWVTKDIGTMASLSRAAAEEATTIGTRAVAVQQGGRALAILGDRQGALRAIGQAEDVLSGAGGDDHPDSLYFYGPAMLTMQRGLILAYLAGSPAEHTAAADLITAGVDAMPADVRESEWMTWYRAQTAMARSDAGDADQALSILRDAHRIVAATGGRKAMREILKAFRVISARWPDSSSVAEFTDALR